MFFNTIDDELSQPVSTDIGQGRRLKVHKFKRLFDLALAPAGCAAALIVGTILFVLNPVFNPGPLLFCQERMGKDGEKFRLWKFRTMAPCPEGTMARSALAPLEYDRISKLGVLLRRYRLDELPNFVNVLRGEMSVIGPRPDAWEHARHYRETVPGYRSRFAVAPGITGLAQVVGGYADSHNAIRRKARFDRFYVDNPSFGLEALIIWRTIRVLLNGFGAK